MSFYFRFNRCSRFLSFHTVSRRPIVRPPQGLEQFSNPNRYHSRSDLAMSSSTQASTHSKSTHQSPRAAVSIVARCEIENETNDKAYYLLIQRGKAPNKGLWSVPGGKIEFGESTIEAGEREFAEETKFEDNVHFAWYPGTFMTSDSIIGEFHYVISQCFVEIIRNSKPRKNKNNNEDTSNDLPRVQPSDDAADAKWFSVDEVRIAQEKNEMVPNLVSVLERAEQLYQNGMLPTTV